MATTLSSNTGNAGNMETTKRRRATSEESKYCHQCRQKRETMAYCKQMKKGKPCNTKFCAACLDNRYAEKAAEVMALENWACPKCRDLCNCSVCRKKRRPSQRMQSPRRPSNDRTDDGSNEKEGNECLGEHRNPEIVLPQGTPLTNIIGVDMPVEDFGHALQFLEFCNAFSKVLDIKEGEPEFIIQELTGDSGCPKEKSPSVHLHIKLFSLIQEDKGEEPPSFSSRENSWFQAVGRLIGESRYRSSEFSLLNKDLQGYDDFGPSTKPSLELSLRRGSWHHGTEELDLRRKFEI